MKRRISTNDAAAGDRSWHWHETIARAYFPLDLTFRDPGRFAGEITDCDVLVVEGTVRASLQDSRRFEIAETGVFEGKVEIDVAEIKGRFEGELTARGRLLIRRTGQVIGRIRYAELEIERGGQISGDVQVIADAAVPRLTDEIKRSRFAGDAGDGNLHLERENDIRA